MSASEVPQPQPVPVNAQMQQLFPTPVVVGIVSDADRLNGALKDLIFARERTHPTTDHSNQGGYQSTWDMEDWGGAPVATLIATVKALATKATLSRDGKAVSPPWKVNCWANVNRSGQSNEPHTHPGSFWSASYYVDDGGIGADPSLGGEFTIQDPRGVAPAMFQPMLTYAGPGGASAGTTELLRPQAGMVVLFPSWLQHGVRPYKGTATRISIAMNLFL